MKISNSYVFFNSLKARSDDWSAVSSSDWVVLGTFPMTSLVAGLVRSIHSEAFDSMGFPSIHNFTDSAQAILLLEIDLN